MPLSGATLDRTSLTHLYEIFNPPAPPWKFLQLISLIPLEHIYTGLPCVSTPAYELASRNSVRRHDLLMYPPLTLPPTQVSLLFFHWLCLPTTHLFIHKRHIMSLADWWTVSMILGPSKSGRTGPEPVLFG